MSDKFANRVPVDMLGLQDAFKPIFEAPWVKQITETADRFQAMMAPIAAEVELFEKAMRSVFDDFEKTHLPGLMRMGHVFHEIAKAHTKYKQFLDIGWLPHEKSPLHLLDEDDAETLPERIEGFYKTNWPEVRETFLANAEQYEIDAEGKATFLEAIEAHTQGLYRVAPRLLFPEMERVNRKELNEGVLQSLASQEKLQESAGRLIPYEYKEGAFYGTELYERLTEHLYVHVNTEEVLEQMKRDPIPNRHASIHGFVVYSSMQSSLNALIMADFIFQIIGPIKAGLNEQPQVIAA